MKTDVKIFQLDEINPSLDDIFNFLYKKNQKLLATNDKLVLSFYKKFIKPKIKDFEENSYLYSQKNKTYENYTSYSFEGVSKIINIFLKPSIDYTNLNKEFERLFTIDVKNYIDKYHKMSNKNSTAIKI
ncbi:MAG: hypothetical protein HY738_16730 [Bacteroidia bacterium]|nr:hypothetical protein [Bacteroidia bacterium]